MKTQFISRLIAGVLLFMLAGNAFSQEIKNLPMVTVTSTSNVSEKVSQAFESSFKDAANERWYKMDRDYLVKFIMNDQKNTALLSKNGSIVYHISYGYEKHIPDEVKTLVKSSYGNYTITSAINVEEGGRNIWVINVEDSKKLIVVRVEDNQLEEVDNYNKTS